MHFFCGFVILLFLIACHGDRELPKPTSEGKNTFGMFVNGKVWVANEGYINLTPSKYIDVQYYKTFFLTSFMAENSLTHERITFYLFGENKPGIYKINSRRFSSICADSTKFGKFENHDYCNKMYIMKDSTTSYLQITKMDTLKKIISGTFYMNLINSKGETIKITDGRFDTNYY